MKDVVCIWQYRFASECVTEVIARTLTAEAPSYATIMELDRKIREFPLLDDTCGGGGRAKSPNKNKCEAQREAEMGESLERFVMDHVKESGGCFLHCFGHVVGSTMKADVNPGSPSVYSPILLCASNH